MDGAVIDLIKRLQEVASWARIVSDELSLSAGGDSYAFNGSTNSVDGLREALDKLDWGDLKGIKL